MTVDASTNYTARIYTPEFSKECRPFSKEPGIKKKERRLVIFQSQHFSRLDMSVRFFGRKLTNLHKHHHVFEIVRRRKSCRAVKASRLTCWCIFFSGGDCHPADMGLSPYTWRMGSHLGKYLGAPIWCQPWRERPFEVPRCPSLHPRYHPRKTTPRIDTKKMAIFFSRFPE